MAKVFEGPDVESIRRRMTTHFSSVKSLKPEGTRKFSAEIYLVGKGFVPP